MLVIGTGANTASVQFIMEIKMERFDFSSDLMYTCHVWFRWGIIRELATDVTYEECRKAVADYLKISRREGLLVTTTCAGWEWKSASASVQISCTTTPEDIDWEDYVNIADEIDDILDAQNAF